MSVIDQEFLSQRDTARPDLARTGPGTPMGAFMRRTAGD